MRPVVVAISGPCRASLSVWWTGELGGEDSRSGWLLVYGRAFKIVAPISLAAVAVLSVTVLVQTLLSGVGFS
jgi:hypothetical protein